MQVFFGAEHPTKGCAHGGGYIGWGCVAVGVDKGTIVFGMLLMFTHTNVPFDWKIKPKVIGIIIV
jgi:hypothetical protein